MKRAKIIGTGQALGSERITNDELTVKLGVTDEWIASRTGIRERCRAAADEYTSTLAVRAAVQALKSAELDASELDLIICTTICPDSPLPSTACLIQAEIGAVNAAAFDLAAACSGFIYALEIAEKMIVSGSHKHILVVSSELMTRYVDYDDSHTAVLFADGAGATIFSASDDGRGILASQNGSDGTLSYYVHTPAGGVRLPLTCETILDKQQFMKMRGRELFKVAVSIMPRAAQIVLDRCRLTLDDIDLIIPHQANQRIIDALATRLNIVPEKIFSNVEFIGNTGSATIPIALDQCLKNGRLEKGNTVLFTAFGGGVTWGAAILEI